MQATIEPGAISGTIIAPPSKSMTQRAFASALLHQSKTTISNAGNSEDELAALQIIQQLGAVVLPGGEGQYIISHGSGDTNGLKQINCGESGLAARLFTPIAALGTAPVLVQASGSLLRRPMHGFADVLPAFGVTLIEFNGYLPITVQGPLQPVSVTVDASEGSQFLSGLLFALSSSAITPVTLTVTRLTSKPYIDMTLQMLSHFGKPITHNNYKAFHIDPALFTDRGDMEIDIEGDWSSAAALLVAGVIAGEITITNLAAESAQADKAIIEVLHQAGAIIDIYAGNVSVKKAPLRAFEFDATDCPDLFPVLAILAACCKGESYIKGVHRLFHKESNRAASIADMLQNFDVPFSMEDDTFCITGVRSLQGTVIESHGDHRIVMAAAVGALRARSQVDIEGADAVSKSYPAFFNDLILCGARCKCFA